jgi:L-seryl-tRNA(Ser) seleniumtransferase
MAQSGAVLREVGTTNRTRAAEYAAAISDRTAVILRVHPSNFRIEGFTERPTVRELADLGRRFQIPVVDDLGSGWLGGDAAAVRDEPSIQTTLADGADVVLFSGDKLLGGPQAGVIAGRRDLIERIRRHPLMRALRVDKMTYAALEATLQAYAAGRQHVEVPVARMIAATAEEIGVRAERLAAALTGTAMTASVVDGFSTIGGGSAPGASLPTRLLQLRHESRSANGLEEKLRSLDPPVIARIENDAVLLDLRTVVPGQDELLKRGLHGLDG